MSEYIYRSNGEPLANERGEILLARAGEIVRCRNCKRFHTNTKGFDCPKLEPDGFCAWGEHK